MDSFVTVTVSEYHTLPAVSVAGACESRDVRTERPGDTFWEAIAWAGGLVPEAGPDILISRPSPDSPAPLLQRIVVGALIHAADPSVNVVLRGGEEIRVPEAGNIFVVGNGENPRGVFRYMMPPKPPS